MNEAKDRCERPMTGLTKMSQNIRAVKFVLISDVFVPFH